MDESHNRYILVRHLLDGVNCAEIHIHDVLDDVPLDFDKIVTSLAREFFVILPEDAFNWRGTLQVYIGCTDCGYEEMFFEKEFTFSQLLLMMLSFAFVSGKKPDALDYRFLLATEIVGVFRRILARMEEGLGSTVGRDMPYSNFSAN